MVFSNPNVPLLIDHAGIAKASMDMAASTGRPKDQQIADLMWAQANWLAAIYRLQVKMYDEMVLNAKKG
jgi:hypothetical protein